MQRRHAAAAVAASPIRYLPPNAAQHKAKPTTEAHLATETTLSHYSLKGAQHYALHHEKNLRTRITTYRERQLLAKALRHIGPAATVLDLPCGTGRFWSAILDSGASTIIAADNSDGMLTVAREGSPAFAEHLQRNQIQLLNTSIFDVALPDNAVDVISCLRFFHHLALHQDRLHVLQELRRVTRKYLLVSLWVDGNLQSARRLRKDARTPTTEGYGPRRCVRRAEFASECEAAGFSIERHYDVAPGWSMWRLYVLRKN